MTRHTEQAGPKKEFKNDGFGDEKRLETDEGFIEGWLYGEEVKAQSSALGQDSIHLLSKCLLATGYHGTRPSAGFGGTRY